MKTKIASKVAVGKLPTTFEALVKQTEAVLKEAASFTVVSNPQQVAPLLKSLKLAEVRCFGKGRDADVTLILDATFKGRVAPHRVSLDKVLMAKLGLADLAMGVGAAPYDSGIVVKGMSVRVRADFLAGPLAGEVRALQAKKPKITAKTVTKATQSKSYKQVLGAKERLAAEAQALGKQLAAVQAKLLKLAKKERDALQAALAKAANPEKPRKAKREYGVVAM